MKSAKKIKDKISTGLSGLSGEYFVAAELSRRGFLASIMLRNTKGIDVLAANSSATAIAAIQVKTCLLYTSPSPRDLSTSRMPSSA